MKDLPISPVAFVHNERTTPVDDHWQPIISTITLAPHIPESSLEGIEMFSHIEIIYLFDQVKEQDIVWSGRPRGNPDYPEMGIFAQRKKDRPNRIGLCTVKLLEHSGRSLRVQCLDAIDGTPVLDIKPVFAEFKPDDSLQQPAWVSDLMKHYW